MGLVMVTVPTSAAADTLANILKDSKSFKTSPYWRQLARIGIAGSAAIGDVTVKVWFGKRLIAILEQTTLGAVWPTDDDMHVISEPALCPPGEELCIEMSGVPTTNPLNFVIEIKELPELGSNPRKPYFRRSRRAY